MAVNPVFASIHVLIKGGGDLATGVALRLARAGLPILITEVARPMMVRRTVSFGGAVYEGQMTVEGVRAIKAQPADIETHLAAGHIPVVVDPVAEIRAIWRPVVLVDAIMAKRNLGTSLADAPLVIALGPGFEAGVDCHCVIETNRGHHLGRPIYQGQAQPDTGTPGPVEGHTQSRVLRAPADGHITPYIAIGDFVKAGDLIATMGQRPITAPFDGLLRGLIHPQVHVQSGQKIGDLDPRAEKAHCYLISDKSLAIGGGVLEAVLASQVVRVKINRP